MLITFLKGHKLMGNIFALFESLALKILLIQTWACRIISRVFEWVLSGKIGGIFSEFWTRNGWWILIAGSLAVSLRFNYWLLDEMTLRPVLIRSVVIWLWCYHRIFKIEFCLFLLGNFRAERVSRDPELLWVISWSKRRHRSIFVVCLDEIWIFFFMTSWDNCGSSCAVIFLIRRVNPLFRTVAPKRGDELYFFVVQQLLSVFLSLYRLVFSFQFID